jgi:hypothetical protein
MRLYEREVLKMQAYRRNSARQVSIASPSNVNTSFEKRLFPSLFYDIHPLASFGFGRIQPKSTFAMSPSLTTCPDIFSQLQTQLQ